MARGPLHIYYHMYLFSLGVWTEGGALSLCPLALALAKTDMWEGHAGQTQANPFGFGIHLDSILVCMSPCYQGSRVSVERIAICMRIAICYMHAIPHACSRDRSRRFSRTPPNNQFFPSLPSPIDMLVGYLHFVSCVLSVL